MILFLQVSKSLFSSRIIYLFNISCNFPILVPKNIKSPYNRTIQTITGSAAFFNSDSYSKFIRFNIRFSLKSSHLFLYWCPNISCPLSISILSSSVHFNLIYFYIN
uniref:Uncharacterized protein n=1 Tax=Heterorhabditis bacteriophora TaxID=37862 RepID=A0A1I7WL67_HETBA